MSRHIQAYFRTEDEAEGARTRLIGYSLDNLEIGRLEEGIGNDREILIPVAPVGASPGMYAGGAQTAGGGSVYTTQGAIPLNNVRENDTEADRDRREDQPESDDVELGTYPTVPGDNDYTDLHYVLSARTDDQHYEEIVQKLRAEGAYVERFD